MTSGGVATLLTPTYIEGESKLATSNKKMNQRAHVTIMISVVNVTLRGRLKASDTDSTHPKYPCLRHQTIWHTYHQPSRYAETNSDYDQIHKITLYLLVKLQLLLLLALSPVKIELHYAPCAF